MPYVIDGPLDCYVWTGRTNPNGTPVIRTRETCTTARRYYWEREKGPIPDGQILLALCGNGVCVRPRHHEPVTWAEWNYRVGRSVLDHRRAAMVLLMRKDGTSNRAIAKHFGVDEKTIREVVRGTHWTRRKGPR